MSPLKLKTRYRGIHGHRLKTEALEAKVALAWQVANESVVYGTSLVDTLLNCGGPVNPVPEDQSRNVATIIQWLGSPVGFAWLVDTLGLEVVRAMRHKAEGGSRVEPGQIYRVSRGCDARQVVVERMRYGVDHALFRLGPNTHWTVQNGDTGRRSYIRELILLDENVWKLVN